MKFAQVDIHRLDNLIDDKLMVTGIYNWQKVFNGDFLILDDLVDASLYDVLFVNVTHMGLDANLLTRLKMGTMNLPSPPKIVVNIDYAPELWKGNLNMYDMARELSCADHILACEPIVANHTKTLMQAFGLDINPTVIPHPIDVDAISEFDQSKEKRGRIVLSMLHRYSNDWLTPWLVGSNCPQWKNVLMMTDGGKVADYIPHFNQTTAAKFHIFSEYIPFLSNFTAAIDSNMTMHTYGRSQTENACLRVPTIGSSNVAAQSILWPELTTDPGDVYTQRQLLQRLFDDEHFWNTTTQYARNKVREYGYEASKRAFMNLLENKDATKIQSKFPANQPA